MINPPNPRLTRQVRHTSEEGYPRPLITSLIRRKLLLGGHMPRRDGVSPLISVGELREALSGAGAHSAPGFPGDPGARDQAPVRGWAR